jgi:hypothetical protein
MIFEFDSIEEVVIFKKLIHISSKENYSNSVLIYDSQEFFFSFDLNE